MAAVARVAGPLAVSLAVSLAGCASAKEAPLPAQVEPPTRLAATVTTGSADVGSFLAESGDLWVRGQCSGGDLQIQIAPVTVLPIPCEVLTGGRFLNQVIMARPTTVTVSVIAPDTVTWDLQVQQAMPG